MSQYISVSENLRKAQYRLNKIFKEYGLTVSIKKTKAMTFKVIHPVRSKFLILINPYNYSGRSNSDLEIKNPETKLRKFNDICRMMRTE
jgi:hypothetical protein